MRTIEICCPRPLRYGASHLAACKGASMFDLLSFDTTTHTNKAGEYFCVVGVQVSDSWLGGVGQPVARPDFDTAETLDLVAAQSVLDNAVVLTAIPTHALGELPAIPQDRMVILIGTGLANAMGLKNLSQE